MSEDISIDIVRKGTFSVVHLQGDIHWRSAPEVRAAILDLFEKRGQELVVVDLKQVKRIDSSGVSILVEGLRSARKRQARFVLASLNESARRMFDLALLTSAFEITETVEQALRSPGLLAA